MDFSVCGATQAERIGIATFMIIAFHGLPYAGKSTAAKMLREHGYKVAPLMAPVKRAAKIVFGLTDKDMHGLKDEIHPTWGMTRRDLLYVMMDALREHWPTYLPDKWDASHNGDMWAIDDIRVPCEQDMVRKRGGVLVRVLRRNLQSQQWHPLESMNLDADYTIVNDNTLPGLRAEIDKLVDKICHDRTRKTQAM